MSSQSRFVNKSLGNINTHQDISNRNGIDLQTSFIGDLKYSILNTDHQGWLKCDGRSLDKTKYKQLFDAIGILFGSDSDTTFNLPDCQGRVIGGAGNGSGLSHRNIGDADGNELHLLSVNELASHSHTGTSNTSGSHNHSGSTANAGAHTHTSNANGGSLGLAYIDGNYTPSGIDNSGGEINTSNTAALTINGAPDHSHTISSDGTHSHTFTTTTTGSSSPFSIMQPTLFIGHVFIYSFCKLGF